MSILHDEPWKELRREIDRSRRFDHGVTLMRAELPAPVNGRRGLRRQTQVLARLQGALRTIDSVWADGDAVYVLLPETEREAAELVVSRLWRELPQLLAFEELRMASFPADGLTAEALRTWVDRAPETARRRHRWSREPAPSTVQPAHESEQ
jgi:hypothetical protein